MKSEAENADFKRCVSLQISLSPFDLRHAVQILPHQLRRWAAQVDEISFTLDREAGGGGDDAAASELTAFLVTLCDEHPGARIDFVDYAPETIRRTAARFLVGHMPPRDYRAGAIYPFLYGLAAAKHDHILHADSDILFGGGSEVWVEDALALLAERRDVLLVGPLPGPPTRDGRVPRAAALRHVAAQPHRDGAADAQPQREQYESLAYRFPHMSWGVFLIDRQRLQERIGPFSLRRPSPRHLLMAAIDRNPPWDRLEVALSHAMVSHGLRRVDILGRAPGMWILHPPYRSETFYRELPQLIRRVEAGDVPAAQLGDYEVNDSLLDWSSAREQARRRRWWRRVRP
jgi:hypothetical protein